MPTNTEKRTVPVGGEQNQVPAPPRPIAGAGAKWHICAIHGLADIGHEHGAALVARRGLQRRPALRQELVWSLPVLRVAVKDVRAARMDVQGGCVER
eukprot:353651-Chlamydomonas_euryale.AAC.3